MKIENHYISLSALYIISCYRYCTLLTCTPYGINTQRLLVRGHQVDESQQSNLYVANEAYRIEPLIVMPIVALLTCLFITFVIKTKTVEDEVESSGKFSGKMLFRVIIKYVAPIFLVIILISSVINGLIDAGYITGAVAEFFKI